MTRKEKAKELVNKFIPMTKDWDELKGFIVNINNAKQCALISVDEILKSNPIIPLQLMLESEALDAAREYWQEVKTEIEKL